ncbi:nucleic-acid-binding protein from transposon X-element [Nephila pilipes]|uniref:Nucleic-acid-binding protein from transposon X-element n=1 Tax=Nephila pilipes TaxID=299642 RepID=A0A8X6PTP5_NEPPI|nr:nucleic-acid-binding protein from transposon X-element [Nephila pilipes]
MESGESVSGCFQSMSLEQLRIAVDTVDNSDSAWTMLSQVEDLITLLPQHEYKSKDHQSSVEQQVLELRNTARYQVQFFARKECEAKMVELNELRHDWDPQSAMNLDDGFQVVRRKHRSPRHNSGDSHSKKQRKVLMDTSNQFDGLSIEEPPDFLVEPTSTSTIATRAATKPNVASNRNTSTRKERPVPPITIDNIPRKDLLIKQLRDLTSGRITARVQGSGIKVFPQTTQAYQQVREFIDKYKLHSFTYQLPENKELRVVIRGLPETTPPGEIIHELKANNISANSCQVMINRRTKLPMPLFLITLDRNEENKLIYSLGELGKNPLNKPPPPPKVNVWEERKKRREELLARNAAASLPTAAAPLPTTSIARLSEAFPVRPTPAVAEVPGTATASIGASLSAFNAPPCRDLLSLVNGFIKISNSSKTRLEKLNEVMALLGEDMTL